MASATQREEAVRVLSAGTSLDGVVTYYICSDEEQDRNLKGGQGQVYKAYCKTFGSDERDHFAVKSPVDPKQLGGLAREAQVYFNIDPRKAPHLAFLNDVVRHEGVPLLVMEWADRGSLSDYLLKQQQVLDRCPSDRLPQMQKALTKQALAYAIQIARGLVSLHGTLGMVHQDLKPGEVCA